MIQTKRTYQVVRVITRREKEVWGFMIEMSEIFVQLSYPLTRTTEQVITIPWHSVSEIYTEDEEDAPWSGRDGS